MMLADFYNKHAGRTGVLYGKGPSLLKHDFEQDRRDVGFAINDAGYTVPYCEYLFLHDAVPASADIMRRTLARSLGCRIVLPKEAAFMSLLPDDVSHEYDCCWYNKTWDLCPNSEQAVGRNALYHGHCTAHSALHFMFVTGIREVRIVGFDGVANDAHALTYPATAEALREAMSKDPNHEAHATMHYSRYMRMLLGMADVLGINILEN